MEYKLDLLEKVQEKKGRAENFKMNNVTSATNSFHNGIQMRDNFYKTT